MTTHPTERNNARGGSKLAKRHQDAVKHSWLLGWVRHLVRLWALIRYNRYTLFAGIVWRPVTGDNGDSWIRSWQKYRMSWQTAWEVAYVVYPQPNKLNKMLM